MAFNTKDSGDDDVMSEINVTPLVDVMLVLLVVFIVTAPLLTQAVHVNLRRRKKKMRFISVSTLKGKFSWTKQRLLSKPLKTN